VVAERVVAEKAVRLVLFVLGVAVVVAGID
jgi:hypothetical protein